MCLALAVNHSAGFLFLNESCLFMLFESHPWRVFLDVITVHALTKMRILQSRMTTGITPSGAVLHT
jgi:hypothetical protein